MQAHVFKSGHCGSVFGAIGAADMALWDIKGKLAGEPVWRLLGASDRFVPGYASALDGGLDDDALLALYKSWAERGFSAAKLKVWRATSMPTSAACSPSGTCCRSTAASLP